MSGRLTVRRRSAPGAAASRDRRRPHAARSAELSTPAAAEPGTGQLDQGVGSLRDRTLLRYGVRPLLLVLDLCAFAAATRLTPPVRGAHVALFVLVLLLFAGAGLYKSRLSLSALDDLPSLMGRSLAAAAIATTAGLLLGTRGDNGLLRTAAVFAVFVVIGRALGYAVVRKLRRMGVVAHPTLILGAGKIGAQLAKQLLEHPDYGLRPVGFLDADPLMGPSERSVPLLGGHESLANVIVEFGVQDVIIAFGSAPEFEMVEIIRTCDRLRCEIFFVPRLFELQATSREGDQVWGLPLVRLRRAAFRSLAWKLKRVFDVVCSGIALVLLSPVMLACAVAVRLETGPGCFFRQERIGLDGRPFQMLKFRSMRPAPETESHRTWDMATSDRVGPVGRVLRTSSLDELPQLWNIFRGDMSIVGPRPERTYFVEQLSASVPRYMDKHRVPAGLTGYAQVHGLRGGDTSLEDRARFDNVYIENWSLWTDIKIILRTVLAVLRGSGR